MVNKRKQKGTRWENDAVKELNKCFPGTWVRVPLSGAIGTVIELPSLKGDIKGKYKFLSKGFVGEAKVGYGGSQMTIQKEWFDKIEKEAKETYGLPVVVLKFEKSWSGVKHVIAMSFETWNTILEEVESIQESYERLYEQYTELQERVSEKVGGDGE